MWIVPCRSAFVPALDLPYVWSLACSGVWELPNWWKGSLVFLEDPFEPD